MNYTLSNQAVGAIMMALQKSLMEQTDIVPVLTGFEIQIDDSDELEVEKSNGRLEEKSEEQEEPKVKKGKTTPDKKRSTVKKVSKAVKAKKKVPAKKKTKKKVAAKDTSNTNSKQRVKASDLQKEVLAFMKKGKAYTSREVVVGLNRTPGGKEGGPVVNLLKKLNKQAPKLVTIENNEGYAGYVWVKK